MRKQLWAALCGIALSGALSGAMSVTARAQPVASGPVARVKIGVLTDFTGAAADLSGRGSSIAARLAVEDFAAQMPGTTIELVDGDMQLKPDVAAGIARRWIDTEGVNAVADMPSSAAALAVNEVIRNSKAVFLVSSSGTDVLTGKACSPNTVQWTYDTWSTANSAARAVVQEGGDTWFMVTADYAFGQAVEKQVGDVVTAMGGKVLGGVRHPFLSPDMTSFMLAAQASGAKIIGLADSTTDAIGAMKVAHEFGITRTQKLAALGSFISDILAVGAQNAEGIYIAEPFYWNLNDGTRAFAKRWAARMGTDVRPNSLQAGVYSSVLHYLKAVKAANSTDGLIVMAKMKEIPADDPLFGKGYVRADGRKIHDMHLFQVRPPANPAEKWDVYREVRAVPGDEAFRPLNQGGCPLVH